MLFIQKFRWLTYKADKYVVKHKVLLLLTKAVVHKLGSFMLSETHNVCNVCVFWTISNVAGKENISGLNQIILLNMHNFWKLCIF